MFSLTSLLLVLQASSFVFARPAEKRWEAGSSTGLPSWVPSTHPFLAGLDTRDLDLDSQCDLQNAVQYMDLSAASNPKPLPSPAADLQLYHVAIGRGTQNYTCDLSNSTAVPVSIGALATLFNASCLAATAPDLLNVLPSIALDLPTPTADNFESVFMSDVSGYQYFVDNFTVPYFNLDTPAHHYGQAPVNKTAFAEAPAAAVEAPMGADGSVDWLQLESVKGKPHKFRQIYRLNTAGGNPPTSCQGQQAMIEVQYAAEYWLFTAKDE